MVSFTASTRQPPAGDPKATIDLDGLLQGLRQGDRAAFERYFREFRAPVHHFAWRLLRDERAAVAATRDALVGAFRRAILGDGAGDLEILTFACALAACDEHAVTARAGGGPGTDPGGASEQRRRRRDGIGAVRQRFEGALESLESRQCAALLLHDLAGLDAARSAGVLGVSGDAAAALLFKAREEFRAGLHQRDGRGAGGGCRQAEDALAGAIGLGMSEDECSRLRRHAGYCRPCRKAMKDWSGTGAGLAAVLVKPPLPQALAATPVFDDVPERPAAAPAPRRAIAAAGRTLRGRAAAWAVAVACLAVAAGVIVFGVGVQPQVLWQSVGPAVRLIVTPPAGEEPAAARPAGQGSDRPAGGIGISGAPAGARPQATASSPAAGPLRSGSDPAPGATVDGQATGRQATQDGPGGASAQGSSTTAARTAAKDAKAAARAARAASRAAAKADKATARAAVADASAAAKASAKAAKTSAKAASKSTRTSAKASTKAGSKSTRTSAKASTRASAKAAKSESKSSGKKKGGSSRDSKKRG